jgi:hypothetical protein
MAEKLFRLRRCENSSQFSGSLERFNRLREKYEGWGVEIPAQFGRYVCGLELKLPEPAA